MNAHFVARFFVLASWVLACACSGEHRCNDGSSGNSLHGSFCETNEMVFSEVAIVLDASAGENALSIEYRRPLGTSVEKTLVIVLDLERVTVEPDEEIDLVDARASVRRLLATGDVSLGGDIERGSTITFGRFGGAIGTTAAGRFAMIFEDGRALSGEFDGTIAASDASGE